MTDLSPFSIVGDIASDPARRGRGLSPKRHQLLLWRQADAGRSGREAGPAVDALLEALRALETAARRDAPDRNAAADRPHPDPLSRNPPHRDGLADPPGHKVETVHGDHDEAPLGLTEALIALRDELDSHMAKEEQVLFPMMRQGGHPMIVHPIGSCGTNMTPRRACCAGSSM
jgi:regulator of cell morphogenesis and NO signaling